MVEIDITQGNLRPIPIAIPQFLGGGPEASQLATNIADIVAADLERSGLFKPIDRAAFVERIATIDAPPRFRDWRVVNAEALVVGQISDAGGGQLKAQFRLWDVFSGRELKGEAFSTSGENWRRIGHLIADAIYQRLTGERGYFDSRVAFVEETGPKDKRNKRLAIMDQDGQNLHYLTAGDTLVLTPRFSPNNREITYTAYEGGRPDGAAARSGERAAGARRQFPGHDLRAALFAERPRHHHEPAAGGRLEPVRDGPAKPADAPADQRSGHRHRPRAIRPMAARSCSNRIAAAGSSSMS